MESEGEEKPVEVTSEWQISPTWPNFGDIQVSLPNVQGPEGLERQQDKEAQIHPDHEAHPVEATAMETLRTNQVTEKKKQRVREYRKQGPPPIVQSSSPVLCQYFYI